MMVTPSAPAGTPPGMPPTASPTISVVVPVYNGGATLARCLEALARSREATWECLVVDDGSTDDSAAIARRWGARVLRSGRRRGGPAHARNVGARAARAPLVCFVDADVVVRPDTLARFAALFEAEPELAAVFGSYDARPTAPGLLSQYRNLVHHFVHQTGRDAASTFWAGCGAIRRDWFLAVGGFDSVYTRPSIEDIELGYRLRAAGGAIRLATWIQVTHLKRWTFRGILETDIRDRALPWTALIVRTGHLPDDLNLDWVSRASAVSVHALLGLLVLGRWWRAAWSAALLPLLVLLLGNRRLYAFFLRERGPSFLLGAVPLHWLYYAYSSLAFAGGTLWYRWRGVGRKTKDRGSRTDCPGRPPPSSVLRPR